MSRLSAMARYLVSLLLNTFMIKCRGVFPSQSITLTSAPRFIMRSVRWRSARTTAKWRALPKMPPPKFTSQPASIKRQAIEKCESLIAMQSGVHSSLSSMSKFIESLYKMALTTPKSPLVQALWSKVRCLLSIWLMSNWTPWKLFIPSNLLTTCKNPINSAMLHSYLSINNSSFVSLWNYPQNFP